MRKIIFLVLSVFAIHANAQKINRVKDINTGSDPSSPVILAALPNGDILFSAYDAINGRELWVSDGTSQGTKIVKDINPGSKSGYLYKSAIYLNGKLYFTGDDGVHGTELWVSDGTTGGTKMLLDIYPGKDTGLSANTWFKYYNNKVYFNGISSVGEELWETDGTPSGTLLVKDMNPGSGDSYVTALTIANGKMFFLASDGNSGHEVWTSDGTDNGTKMIVDFYPGALSGASGHTMIEYNGKVYFAGQNPGSTGIELCSTDGTAQGTKVVKNINAASNSEPERFMVVNGKLLFTAKTSTLGKELWVTDGTENGTKLLKNIYPGASSADPAPLGILNNKLIFRADDGTHGNELWITDGTSNGTKLLYDINTGSGDGSKYTVSSSYSTLLQRLTVNNVYNGVMYLNGDDGTNGSELWRTDGTDTGTYMVEDVGDIPNNATSSELDFIFVDSNNVWLAMTDGAIGKELFLHRAKVSTTPQSIGGITAERRATLYPNPNNGTFSLNINNPSFLNGLVRVYDITGREVYSQGLERGQSQTTISLNNIATGIYKVLIELDRHVEVHTVSISK